jgi:hypothetical protein
MWVMKSLPAMVLDWIKLHYNNLQPGASLELLLARDGKVFTTKCAMKTYAKPQFSLQITDPNAPLLTYWLR